MLPKKLVEEMEDKTMLCLFERIVNGTATAADGTLLRQFIRDYDTRYPANTSAPVVTRTPPFPLKMAN